MIRTLSTCCCLVCLLIPALPVHAEEIAVARFAREGLAGWEEHEFRGKSKTSYQLVKEEGRTVLRAQAKGSASALVRELGFDPAQYRYLKWSWKIAQTIAAGDETTRRGDDYAARVYVIFPGRFFWQTRALNYIWANRLPREGIIANAFTASAMMLAVESGSVRAGEWHTEERDILADYRRAFGAEPPRAGGVAIMTDADNTDGYATAWYGDITLATDRANER